MNPYFSIDHSIDYNNNIYEYIYILIIIKKYEYVHWFKSRS